MALPELKKLITEAETWPEWPAESGTEYRHALIRRMADFYRERSLRKTAQRIAGELSRYQQGRWRHDQHQESVPGKYRGNKSEVMFQLMHISDGKVPSDSRIAEILAGRKCGKNS